MMQRALIHSLIYPYLLIISYAAHGTTANDAVEIQDYVAYVKYLLQKASHFRLFPEPLKCIDIDPEKNFIWYFADRDEGIKICDTCPNFPMIKLTDTLVDDYAFVALNRQAPNMSICFSQCADRKDCVAFSFDHLQRDCFLFNATSGRYKSEFNWTTVLMKQPVEIIQNWLYTRHTKISGFGYQNISTVSKEPSLLSCLDTCEKTVCGFASYNLPTKTCRLFVALNENETSVTLEYGEVAAFRLDLVHPSNKNFWRFVNFESQNEPNISRQDSICQKPADESLGNFSNPMCLSATLSGCNPDATSSCQKCYYPEIANNFHSDLPICRNSRHSSSREGIETKWTCFNTCIQMDYCIGVTIDDNNECAQVTFDSWPRLDQRIDKYDLLYPNATSPLAKFSWIFKSSLLALQEWSIHFLEVHNSIQLKDCLNFCLRFSKCVKISYDTKKKECKLASDRIGFVSDANDSASVTFFRKPPLTSELIYFQRTPGWRVDSTEEIGRLVVDEIRFPDTAVQGCLERCLREFNETCQYISIKYDVLASTECSFFDSGNHTIVRSRAGEVFTRSLVDLNLETLNSLPFFQPEDIVNCFRHENQQTQTTLAGSKNLLYDSAGDSNFTTPSLTVRRRRGFFGDLWKGIKNFGNAIVDTVKDAAKTVIDTAKGAVETIGKVVQGDWEGVKNKFLDIPIVKSVKETGENLYKLGKSVVAGDLGALKGAAVDLLSSDIVSVIPIGGAATSASAKMLKNIGKRATKTAKKDAKKGIVSEEFADKNINRGKRKKAEDKSGDRGRKNQPDYCRRRVARAASAKRKRPGCDDHDKKDDNAGGQKCQRPKVKNVVRKSLSECHLKRRGAICKFECQGGYKENANKSTCREVRGSKKSLWTPNPACVAESCGSGNFPLIPVEIKILSRSVNAFVVKFDKLRKLPIWSTYFQDRINGFPIVARPSRFTQHPCVELKHHQASDQDYRASSWTKGHLTPALSMRFSNKATIGSNMYINVAPQDAFTNKGLWGRMEGHIFCELNRTSGLVATGVCPRTSGSPRRTKSAAGVEVPSCFWKMVCYKKAGSIHVVGFIVDNSRAKSRAEKESRRNQVRNLISQAQIKGILGTYASFDPWILSGRHVSEGRSITMASSGVSTAACSAQLRLNGVEARLWSEALGRRSSAGRLRRNAEDSRGCTPTEAKAVAALMGLPSLSIDDLDLSLDFTDNDEETSDDDDAPDDANLVQEVARCGKRLIGYYPSWGSTKFSSKQASRLTHVVFAFMETKSDGAILVGSADPGHSTNLAQDASVSANRLEQLIDVAKRFEHLKLMFAVGGWENSQYFSQIAQNPQKRLAFIGSAIKVIDTYGFDGIDLDWEYPVTGGAQEGIPSDKDNYVLLVKELRQALDTYQTEAGRQDRYLISFAGAAGQWTLDPGFDLPGLLKYADWANVMSYDFFGPWESKWGAFTGPPAPLYFAMPPRFSGKTNADFAIKYYLCQTREPHKINMGVPFYGRYWRNVGNPIAPEDEMWRKANIGADGKYEGGFVSWNDIKKSYLTSSAYNHHFHNKAKTPYAWNPSEKIYLGYEDPKSLKFKVDYAVDKNLGGLMIWAIDQDDQNYSMLNVIAKAPLCRKMDPREIAHRCSPLTEKRWWTWDENQSKAGMCGRSAPLYKGYYPVCDPDDPGYSCCGPAGYCGSGSTYCGCPKCIDYMENPEKLMDEPVKPTSPVRWYTSDAADGKRGRCGRDAPKLSGEYPICNPDDANAHCCSNGGYCGSSPEHCVCDGCIDFKKLPSYKYQEKRWWSWADGANKSGKCGPSAPKINGQSPICDPDSRTAYCCSSGGYCGSTTEHCSCKGCVNYRQ